MTLAELIAEALKEDMPRGDLTTDSLALAPRFGEARLIAKEDIVLSGTAAFEQTILALDPSARVQWKFKEGDLALNRQTISVIDGDLIQILKAERVALNFVGHLSGIATFTRCFVKAVEGTQTKILDTRKTMPAFRVLERRAVVHGGGFNHRNSLSDAILIKDNHIAVAGGVPTAVERVRRHSSEKIEIEASDLAQTREAVACKVDRILLDNMSDDLLAEALKLIPPEIETEASGNMTVGRVRSVAKLGVAYISVGALTHSAPVADISLVFDWSQTDALRSSGSEALADVSEATRAWAEASGLRCESFKTIGSTNDQAKQDYSHSKGPFAAANALSAAKGDGAPKVVLYLAQHQTAGRGRGSNTWTEPKLGSALLSTWSVAMATPPQPILAPLLGLALYRSLQATFADLAFSLKAPNDVYLDGFKVAGILIETVDLGSSRRAAIGVGINVLDAPKSDDFAATSLGEALARKNKKSVALDSWKRFLDAFLLELAAASSAGLHRELTPASRLELKNALNQSGKSPKVTDVDAQGQLTFSDGRFQRWQDL